MKKNKIVLPFYRKTKKFLSRGYGSSSRFSPISSVMNSVESRLKSDYSEILGHKMYLDPTDSLNLSIDGIFGEFDTSLVQSKINENDIVVDLGANIGYYTLLSARKIGENGKVFSFEPEPTNFELLKKNIQINNYKNVILEQKAVSDKPSKEQLFLSDKMEEHSFNKIQSKGTSITVDCIALDDYFGSRNLIDKINFIKIDVEGAEPRALSGMKKILKESKNLKIFTEFMRNFIENSGHDPKKMLDILLDNAFTIYYVDAKNKQIIPADVDKLLTSNTCYTTAVNLFCEKQK